jgi:hypothetical protein
LAVEVVAIAAVVDLPLTNYSIVLMHTDHGMLSTSSSFLPVPISLERYEHIPPVPIPI